MKNRLYIIEGLPCSGKSTTSAQVAALLEQQEKVVFVDEGTGDHLADYEYHALAPSGLLSEASKVVPLSAYSGELLAKLLQYKIYDALPWEAEMPLMLDKWRALNGAFGKSIGAVGFDGYIRCLKERQSRELRILSQLPVASLIVNNPQRDWPSASETIKAYLLSK